MEGPFIKLDIDLYVNTVKLIIPCHIYIICVCVCACLVCVMSHVSLLVIDSLVFPLE